MKKLRIGIVGLNFGEKIVEELKKEYGSSYFEVAAVCDINTERAAEVSGNTGIKAYIGIDDLLMEKDIPVIGLFVPPVGRADLIEKIILTGRDVITTKPFELDADKALAVLKKAKKIGRIIHLNSPSPLPTPDIDQIKKWIEKYNLGRPIACRCDTWTSYREDYEGNWYDEPEKCPVAPIFRIGIYLVNDIVRLFGKAEKVQVMHSRLFTGRPTPDNAQVGIMFKNGAICNIFASFCINDVQTHKNSLLVNYEKGTVYRNVEPMKYTWTDRFSKMTVVAFDKDNNNIIEHATVEGISGDYQWDLLYKAVTGEKLEGEITPEEIVEGIRIINAMARAEKSGYMESV